MFRTNKHAMLSRSLTVGMHSFETWPSDCTSKPSNGIKQGPHIPVYFKARGGAPYRPPAGDTR